MNRRLKTIITIVLFLIIILITQLGLRYILIEDNHSYTRVMLHELYNPGKNIDALFVGSSHCYRAVNPKITDEVMGLNTFNAGSSSQYIDGAYAMIREAAKNNKLKSVYVEVEHNTTCAVPFEDRSNLQSTYILSEYMPFSLNKLQFLALGSSIEKYPNSFMPLGKYKEMLDDPAKIPELLEDKNSDDYRNYAYVKNSMEEYRGKGYVSSEAEIQNGTLKSDRPFLEINLHNISDDWKKTEKKIVKFCKDNDIELYFFTAPMPDFYLKGIGNYDAYVNKIKGIFEEDGIPYADFNLCREQYLSLEDDDYMDDNHLNMYGADKFTEVFARYYAGEIKDEEIFCENYEATLQEMSPKIFGLIVEDDKRGHCIKVTPVTNADASMITYSSEFIPIDQDRLIENSEENPSNLISYTEGQSGTMFISAYLNGEKTNEVSMVYGKQAPPKPLRKEDAD
ncbi:MAG: hypothetical protein K6F99_00215 [Lachnospiraceae bacterium]|nr:hypothetical protein [Lachnospiraceae bacterium]